MCGLIFLKGLILSLKICSRISERNRIFVNLSFSYTSLSSSTCEGKPSVDIRIIQLY
uniref:Candidate secreted effector n=1 Tax=Meloidogyne incognita TaxID=6306 RepID=A0A914MBX2_MELIC